jgi:hypothetical protein
MVADDKGKLTLTDLFQPMTLQHLVPGTGLHKQDLGFSGKLASIHGLSYIFRKR